MQALSRRSWRARLARWRPRGAPRRTAASLTLYPIPYLHTLDLSVLRMAAARLRRPSSEHVTRTSTGTSQARPRLKQQKGKRCRTGAGEHV